MKCDHQELRFVVLRHEGVAEPHFDLLIERAPGALLAAWRSAVWPIESAVELAQMADHRRAYLEYEGEIAGGRGRVRRVAEGTCAAEMETGRWRVELRAGARSQRLLLRHVGGNLWMAAPEV